VGLDCVRESADKARTSDCVQQYRTTQLTIRTFKWAGGALGVPPKELVSELVMPKYEVKELGDREVNSPGGRFRMGDVRVLDISPPYTKADGVTPGGYTKLQLDPQSAWTAPDFEGPTQDREVEYVLTGETEGVFSLVALETSNVTSWRLVLRNTRKSP
jgi:hypothetical protein